MDSGHSDSSSCGEDQEYDSRAAAAAYSFSSFVNQSVPPQPPPFDPFSGFLHLQNCSQLNSNVFWSRNADLASDPCPNNNIINFPFTVPPQPPTVLASGTDVPPASAAENGGQNRNPAARNTKKRSRASRRAPTTVLTTDTSNFRAMVQEFTGIPAPPFTSSSPFQRSRLDIFGASSSMRLKPHDAAQPPYLHRPFALEVQRPQPFLTSTASISSSTTTNSVASTSTPPMNYHSLPTQNSSLFNLISNPNLTSFLPTDDKFPFSSSILPSKIQPSLEIPTNHGLLHSNVKTVGFDEFSLRPRNVSATIGNLPNLIPSDQIQPRNDHNNDNNNADEIDHGRAETRTLNGIHNYSRNYLQNNSSTDFHGSKGQENIGTRSSEGMMESWICSSELK